MKEYKFGYNGDSSIPGRKRQLITSSSFLRVNVGARIGYIVGYIIDPFNANEKDSAIIAFCNDNKSVSFFEAESKTEYDFYGSPTIREADDINIIVRAKSDAVSEFYANHPDIKEPNDEKEKEG